MSIIQNPATIELDDIQSLMVRGHGQLPICTFILMRISEAKSVRAWLRAVLHHVTPADQYDEHVSLNLAFTHSGLKALGLNEENLLNFPIAFREGMVTAYRQRILGDIGESAPEHWRWGGPGKEAHILLALYAADEQSMNNFTKQHLVKIEQHSMEVVYQLDGYRREDGKEQFGFHDSISQPVIMGSGRKGPDNDIIATGEFVLGYKNEHGRYPYSPLITRAQGDLNMLRNDAAGSGYRDLGRNGTFVVYRQFQQKVHDFWDYMHKQGEEAYPGEDRKAAAVKLASKMIGRWPGGAPLTKFPDKDPESESTDNDFGYAKEDPHGIKCPFGSHLRRNNPRDSFRYDDPELSLKITKRHRIIRRGRLYKLPAEQSENGVEELGLHFLGINTSIEQQFEFIQHAWANNGQMVHLTNDPDPVIGVPDEHSATQFTIPQEPVARCVRGLQRFVTVRGGAYFFMPGISALRYLATIGERDLLYSV
jgi:Dyp-type peroxidase family